MFKFLLDIGNYDERKVARFEKNELFVSTVKVSDGRLPFETAVSHPFYNGNKIVIVEAYMTIKQAKDGHEKWVKLMTTEPLPERLVDCHNSHISQLMQLLTND